MTFESAPRDSAVMDDAYDEHHYDPKSESTVDAITGTTEVEPDRSKEVIDIAEERKAFQDAVQQLVLTLNASGKSVSRVSQACSEIIFKTVTAPRTGEAFKLCGHNQDRSRLVITPIGMTTAVLGIGAIGTDPNLNSNIFNPATNTYPFNASLFRIYPFDSTTVAPMTMEIRTVRDLYVIVTTPCVFGLQEEFVA